MKQHLKKFATACKTFRRSEDGSSTLELMTVLPAAMIPNCLEEVKLEMVRKEIRNFSAMDPQPDCIDREERGAPRKDFATGGNNDLMILRVCALFDPVLPTATIGAALPKQSQGAYAPITPEYMTGVDALLKTLIRGDDTPNFRITAFTYDNESAQYGVAWSQDSGLYPALDDTSLNAEAHRLPLIKDGQRAILVETWIDHTPVTGDGIPGVQEFENFMVASMRFVPQLCFLPSETATVESAQC